jgi:hypothetical protein
MLENLDPSSRRISEKNREERREEKEKIHPQEYNTQENDL